MQLKSGTFLQGGKYKIIHHLGQGSFGITYLAEHTALGKRVCIKEFFMKELNLRSEDGSITGLSEGTLSYNYAQKFRKEAMNLAGMEHPNIVRVTDSFDENGTFYYVMEYIQGENLNEYIRKHRISIEDATMYIKTVADALMYMHEKMHMLHLDLKPSNIMRRSDGHVYLIDFGLSKHYDEKGTPETSTTIGLGTPGYAPIELGNHAKSGEFLPTIDVYSLGATYYKLLTTETPPIASDIVSDEDLIPKALCSAHIPQEISSVVIKAMTPSVKKRTRNVREFITALSINKHVFNKEISRNTTEHLVFINKNDEETVITNYNTRRANRINDNKRGKTNKTKKSGNAGSMKIVVGGVLLAIIGSILFFWTNSNLVNLGNEEIVEDSCKQMILSTDNDYDEVSQEDYSENSNEKEDIESEKITMLNVTKTKGKFDYDHEVKYITENLVDGKLKTCWALDVRNKEYYKTKGFGPVHFYVDCKRLDYIVLYNGYQKNDKTFWGNPRAKYIAMYNAENPSEPILESMLEDTKDGQKIHAIHNSCNLNISEIIMYFPGDFYYPAKWNDLSISEIEFFGVK